MSNIKKQAAILAFCALSGCTTAPASSGRLTAPVYAQEIRAAETLPYEEFKKDGNNKIYFTFDSSKLSKEAESALTKQAEWLNTNQNATASIEGYCDEVGAKEYNYALGLKRAYSAKRFLEKRGVDKERLSVTSYGDTKPNKLEHDKISQRANRRVVTVVH